MGSLYCCIFNVGAHYRLPIYSAMASEFHCDFYLGDRMQYSIKTFDYTKFAACRGMLHNIFFFSNFYWQRGSIRLLFAPYRYYLLDGEPYCVSSWIILFLAKLLKKKTIAWTHGWYGKEGFLKSIIKKIFYSQFSQLLIYSEYSIELMRKNGFNPRKMHCIANSLDYDNQLLNRKALKQSDIFSSHFGNNNPVLFYIGRIQHVKKLHLILQCAAQLQMKGTKVNVVIVGKDIEGVNLESYIQQLTLEDSVWLYGACYDESIIGEMFYNAAICISPGNVGLTAIHSLTYGCPVITHDNFSCQMPEFESIIKGRTGDFFIEDSIDDLTNKVNNWLMCQEPNRDRIRKDAYETVDLKWNYHYQIKILKQVLYE